MIKYDPKLKFASITGVSLAAAGFAMYYNPGTHVGAARYDGMTPRDKEERDRQEAEIWMAAAIQAFDFPKKNGRKSLPGRQDHGIRLDTTKASAA